MPIWFFVDVVRSRWKLATGIWVSVIAIVLAATTLGAWQYSAATSVLVEPKVPDPAFAGQQQPPGNHVPTEIEVLRSERVALRAIDALGLQDHAGWKALWQKKTHGAGDFRSWLSEQLLDRLDIRPARDANVLTVTYTSGNPATAAEMANAFTQAYLDITNELRQEPAREYGAYVEDRASRLRAALVEAQRKHAEFQQKQGLVGSAGSIDTEMLKLAELSSQVVTLQAMAASASSRQRQASQSRGAVDEVLKDPVVSALTAELSRQQTRLGEMRTRMGELHPMVIEMRQGIDELRARIDGASRRVTATVLSEDRVAAERLSQARAALEAQRAKVMGMGSARNQAAVLEREVENAQRAYDAVLHRASQAALESGGVRRTVSVLRKATRPALPSWPNVPLCLAAAAVIGIVLALFGVFLRERMDSRLRNGPDQALLLGMQVLAVLRNDHHGAHPRLGMQ